MMEKIKFSWNDFDLAVSKLSKDLEPVVPFVKNIYAIPRGGLVLAVALSHRINKPLIFDKKKIRKDTLIVDDISHTGQTFTKLLKDKEYLRTITLISKSSSNFQPTYTYLLDDTDVWTVFPYETDESSKYDNL